MPALTRKEARPVERGTALFCAAGTYSPRSSTASRAWQARPRRRARPCPAASGNRYRRTEPNRDRGISDRCRLEQRRDLERNLRAPHRVALSRPGHLADTPRCRPVGARALNLSGARPAASEGRTAERPRRNSTRQRLRFNPRRSSPRSMPASTRPMSILSSNTCMRRRCSAAGSGILRTRRTAGADARLHRRADPGTLERAPLASARQGCRQVRRDHPRPSRMRRAARLAFAARGAGIEIRAGLPRPPPSSAFGVAGVAPGRDGHVLWRQRLEANGVIEASQPPVAPGWDLDRLDGPLAIRSPSTFLTAGRSAMRCR